MFHNVFSKKDLRLCNSILSINECTYCNLQGKLCNFQVSVFVDLLKSAMLPFSQKLTALCNYISFINECTVIFFTKEGKLCNFRDSVFLDSFINECYLPNLFHKN